MTEILKTEILKIMMSFSVDFLYNPQRDTAVGQKGSGSCRVGKLTQQQLVWSMIQGYYKNKNKCLECGLTLNCAFSSNFRKMRAIMPDTLDI